MTRATLRILSGLLACLLTLLAPALRGTTKLAVWSEPGQADLAAVLAARITLASPDAILLERAEVAAAFDEARIAALGLGADQTQAVDRLLGADALLWVQSVEIDGRPRTLTRLAGARDGILRGWRLDASPPPDLDTWAGLVATDARRWLTKLPVPPGRAIPITLLNLREIGRSTPTPTGPALCRLLAAELVSRPEVLLLERWKMQDLALETELLGPEARAFWNGAWVIDGAFTRTDDTLDLELRLRAADGREFHARRQGAGDDIDLVAALVADLLRQADLAAPRTTWDTAAEARAFFEEAVWADRWKQERQAVEMIEAAIALGHASPEALRLRYLAYGRLAVGPPTDALADEMFVRGVSRSSRSFVSPDQDRLSSALQALAHFADVRAGRPDACAALDATVRAYPGSLRLRRLPWHERDTRELLTQVARLLYTADVATPQPTVEEDKLVRELRAAARELFRREWSAIKPAPGVRDPERLHAEDRIGGMFPTPLESLPQLGLALGPLWAESPDAHATIARAILMADFVGDPWLYDDLLLALPPKHQLDWRGKEGDAHDPPRVRAAWASLESELMREPDLGLRIAAATSRLSIPPAFAEWSEAEKQVFETGQAEAWQVFIDEFDAVIDGRLPVRFYIDARSRCTGYIPTAARTKLVSRLETLAENKPSVVLDRLVAALPLTADARRRLAAHATPVPPPTEPAPVSPPTDFTPRRSILHPEIVWRTPPVAPNAKRSDPHDQVLWAAADQHHLWLVIDRAGSTWPTETRTLVQIDLPEASSRELFTWSFRADKVQSTMSGFPRHALLDGHLYGWETDRLVRRSLATGQPEPLTLPLDKAPQLWALDGKLHVGLAHGGILRVDPRTLAWELLADSRRRPALGTLDDCPPYTLENLWTDPDGTLHAMKRSFGEVYTRTTSGAWSVHSEWRFAFSPANRAKALGAYPRLEYAVSRHRDIILAWLLGDIRREGRRPEGYDAGVFWGAETRRDAWLFRCGMIEDEAIWGLFKPTKSADERPTHLAWMPPAPHTPAVIRLEPPADSLDARFGDSPRFLPAENDLFIYARGGSVVWRLPRASLACAGIGLP